MDPQRQTTSRIGLVFIAAGLAILAVLGAHVYSQAQSKQEAQSKQAAIQKVLETQAADWNRGDLDAFMVGYWKSEQLSFFSDKAKRGWKATHDRYKEKYKAANTEMGTLTFDNLEIELLGPDNAFVRGRWQLVQRKGALSGLFTLIVRKFPDGWRIVHDHTT